MVMNYIDELAEAIHRAAPPDTEPWDWRPLYLGRQSRGGERMTRSGGRSTSVLKYRDNAGYLPATNRKPRQVGQHLRGAVTDMESRR